jgi:hypothetical protein
LDAAAPGLVAAFVITSLVVTREVAAEVAVRVEAGADILLHHIQEVVDVVKTCSGLWGKGITCATCVVLLLLPHLYEHLLPFPASEIRHVNRP